MTESSRIVYRGGTGEITEKKSRFIADIRPVSTEEEALAFIEEIRKKYWDARHHCYAYILGERGQQSRCSERAYSGAVKEGLSQCVLMEKRPGRELAVTAGYGDVGKVQYLAAQAGIETLDTVYEADVRFSFLVSLEEEGGFVKKLTEGTAGRAKIQPGDQVFYGMGPDGLVVFR